jgi:hypothetical protein
MPTNTSESLADRIKREREQLQHDALGAIEALAAIANRHELADPARQLAETAEGLQSETFKMIVMGRFKNGKSTLINALMGGTTRAVDLGGAQGPMVVDDLPATAVLSEVSYAEIPYIRALKEDGVEEWTLAQYLRESTLGADNAENIRRFAAIEQFQIGFPARLCESQVTLYDSPGLDESALRTLITMNAVRRSDAALMVYKSDALFGETELKDDNAVRGDGTHVFVVVNLFNNKQVDEKLRGYVWNKYVLNRLDESAWAGQDLADHDIYFVNAKMAIDARYGPGGPAAEQAYRESGLAALEERLGEFLLDERFIIDISNFSKKALSPSGNILQSLSQQEASVTADRDRFRLAWEEKRPEIDKLQTRPGRLPEYIDSARNRAILELNSGIRTVIAAIRGDLPQHLEATTLPTESAKTFSVWHQKKLMAEATAEVNSFITGRITNWSENVANPLLHDIAGQLSADVNAEVAKIGRDFEEINMALTDWDSAKIGTPGNVHSTTERVTATIAGLLLGDISAAVGGAKGGYRGALGGIVGAGAATWILIGVLGITSGVVLVPILAIAALAAAIGGSAGLVKRIKQKALDTADQNLAVLPLAVEAKMTASLDARFAELKTAITAAVQAFIDEEVGNLNKQVAISQQNEAEKAGTLRGLKQDELEVLRLRAILNNTATQVAGAQA